MKSDQFYAFFMDALNNPNQLWENAFYRRISPAARDLLLLLYPFPQQVSVSTLRDAYEPYHRHQALSENRPLRAVDFMDALKEAEGTFITIDRSWVSYHNPSVRDFIAGYLRENDGEFQALCDSARDFELCVLLAKAEPGLCRLHHASLVDALRRTCVGMLENGHILFARMRNLAEINRLLDFVEIRAILMEFLQSFPGWLETEQEELEEETWHYKVSPHDLLLLLQDLEQAGLDDNFSEELYTAVLRYVQVWFSWAFTYSIGDFLLLPYIHSRFFFSAATEQFRPVYELLDDFRDDYAEQFLLEMDYGSECNRFLEHVEALEAFYGVDLSDVKDSIDDRIFEIQEMEEDDEPVISSDEFWGGKLSDRSILDMFQSLLDRETVEDDGQSA